MRPVTIRMGSKGLASLLVNGEENILQVNNPPQLVHAVSVDSSGVRTNEATAAASTQVSGNTVVQVFAWGFITTTYTGGDRLSIRVTVTNTSAARSIDHLWIYALGICLPAEPCNYDAANCGRANIDAPSSLWWDYGTGTIDLVNDDVERPLGLAWYKATSSTMAKQYISLNIDSLQTVSKNWPPTPRPIPPGQSDTYTLSLRFGDPGTDTETVLATDVFASYASRFPRTAKPRVPPKPIAAINLTSARFTNDVRDPLPQNPRGWFHAATDIDVRTPAGVADFQARLLQSATDTIGEMTRVGAMGAIFWDLEGQQYDASYIGDPCQMEAVAPELVGVIDDFLAKFRNAGFEVGFCVRPQVFLLDDASQTNTDDPGGVMFKKMNYAVERWGATLFYVDSNLDYAGTLNQACVFQSLALALPPGVLIFPEWENTRHYAYTIPYNAAVNNLFGAPASTLQVYPDAVGLVKVNDPASISYPDEITAAAKAGNILLFDGWYPHAANDLVKKIYEEMM